MILQITLKKPICGYWDGGAKRFFGWEIQNKPQKDDDGYFVKVGCWEANQWLNIGCGKIKMQTDKQILANLKTKLLKTLAKNSIEVESAIIIE